MFKEKWEKTASYELPQAVVEQIVKAIYPKENLSFELISGGCSNLNYKLFIENDTKPSLLRIYLRDKNAMFREQKLTELLKNTIPVPQTLYLGEYKKYHFAITEFIKGITLREYLLSSSKEDMSKVMYEIGIILSKIGNHKFKEAGSFDNDLNVIKDNSHSNFLEECLENEVVKSTLSKETIKLIRHIFVKFSSLLCDNEKHLVHGDFGPENILINYVDNSWKVSSVIDWEFSFSGSVLWDVANMLRYSHKMPRQFQDAFLNGLKSSGNDLSEDWETKIRLLNLLSILDCLKRSDLITQPNRCGDILELVHHILKEFS